MWALSNFLSHYQEPYAKGKNLNKHIEFKTGRKEKWTAFNLLFLNNLKDGQLRDRGYRHKRFENDVAQQQWQWWWKVWG